HEIADTARVELDDGSLLDLNGFRESIRSLTLEGDATLHTAPSVTTGNGKLTVYGDVHSYSPFGSGCVPSATISGNLDLGGATRNIETFSNSPLTIAANITNGGIDQIGGGILELDGQNTYTGTTTADSGLMLLNSDGINDAVSSNLVIGDGSHYA